ncbi:MAG: hypothetical protein JXB29_11480 [Sedimentisphaerales bacterium]|nr:hypothetical protein [Sedimentisphaerales bacterium]
MMGKPNQLEPKLFYHGLSLDRRMPQDHPLRKIEQLVDGETIHVDSSTIDANASKDTLRCQLRVVGHNLYEELEDNAESPQKLEKHVSTTDPDARLFTKRGKTTLGYKDHRAQSMTDMV